MISELAAGRDLRADEADEERTIVAVVDEILNHNGSTHGTLRDAAPCDWGRGSDSISGLGCKIWGEHPCAETSKRCSISTLRRPKRRSGRRRCSSSES